MKLLHQKDHLETPFPFRLWIYSTLIFPSHWHEIVEIVYILDGKTTVSVENQIFKCRQDDIIIINSNMVHEFFDSEPGTILTIFQFGLELFDQFLLDLCDDRVDLKRIFTRKIFISRKEDRELQQKLESLLLSIQREYFLKEAGYHLAIKARLYELALIFLRELPVKEPVSKGKVRHNFNNQILERVLSFIYRNFGNPEINLEQVACEASLSKFYFTRFFKEQTGMTFYYYLSKIRINQAKAYLVETDHQITEIACLCGFSTTKTFNKLFKTFTGVAPSTYRLSNKETVRPSAI
jgi:AraC-like DNA-binding protein